MFSLLRFPALAKIALGGAAGSMLIVGAAAAGPSVLAAAPGAAAPATKAAPAAKHHGRDAHRDRKQDRRVEIEAYLNASAAIMKMEPDDLRAALKSGRSMAQIASEHGFPTKKPFADAVSKAVRPALDAAVDAKKITRLQADRFQDRLAHGHLPLWDRHAKK